MSFTSSDEVATYIGGIFETAFADAELGPKLAETGIVLEFDFSDPETHLIIDTTAGAVHNGREGAPEPAATMSMTADVGNAYWQGKVNLPMAMAKKKIKVEGNVASLLKLAPLSKKLFPTYIERLTVDGRDDLLV
ncbi:SCP2 sterol-binding domain-containing protein [Williamsia sp. MIQD14]|uniref:SCP2 sterol-binding domain-containing protein n=1 Tax=Williamsia sp. MIQD14 TaxID=3425703 RepID=UPI003DA070C0